MQTCPEGSTCYDKAYSVGEEGNEKQLYFCVGDDNTCPATPEGEENNPEEQEQQQVTFGLKPCADLSG